MFCWITFLGGVLIMMGQHSRLEALWFTGLRPDQGIPHHSMFSKNRHG
jgi:hypothetical protein